MRIRCSAVPLFRLLVVLIIAVTASPTATLAQDSESRTTSVAFRGVPLDQALATVSEKMGLTIAYESDIVAGLSTYCIADDKPVEAILHCLLKGTELDFFRLSSGAFVLAKAARQSPLFGYLNGVVSDVNTGKPLENANVVVGNRLVGTATNSAGQFVLPPLLPGPYDVTVSHVSYQPWRGSLTVGPGNVNHAAIRMRTRTMFVAPIVVDASDQSNLTADSFVQTTEALEAASTAGIVDQFQNLNELSGVRISDVTADIRVDGSSSGELVMHLDGVPVFLPRTTIGLVGPFSPLAIDRFVVHRVGFGVRPGSYVAGVVEAQHGASSDALSHVQVDPTGVNGRMQFGHSATRASGMIAGRFGLWQVFAPSRLSDVLSAWSAADPFLLVAPTRRYEYATESFITDTLALRVNLQPAVRYNDVHSTLRFKVSPLRTIDASFYLGENTLEGSRTSSAVEFLHREDSQVSDLSIGDNYKWRNFTGQVRYSSFLGNRTLVQLQGKTSIHNLRHGYELIEDLFLPTASEVTGNPVGSNTAVDVSDDNRVRFAELSTTFDHARTNHSIGGGVDISFFDNSLRLRSSADFDLPAHDFASPAIVSAQSSEVNLASRQGLLSIFAEDRWSPHPAVSLTAGVRSTFVTAQRAFFTEPKLAVSARARSPVGTWTSSTSAGIYRQYVVQTDVSKLNAGSLLPTIRLWVPIDGSTAPPQSYHLAQRVSLSTPSGFELAGEAYANYRKRNLSINYVGLANRSVEETPDITVDDLLTVGSGRTAGVAIRSAYTNKLLSASMRYGFTHGHVTNDSLFGGRRTSAPGVDPHELDINLSIRPFRSMIARLSWRSTSGRSRGFTSAYYDYFGHSEDLREHGGHDFGDPDSHVLPAYQQLDASLAVGRTIGKIGVQIRADIINVLDRSNVAEWKLLYASDELIKVARPLYPRLTTMSIRLSW